jgi:hypothetical protein
MPSRNDLEPMTRIDEAQRLYAEYLELSEIARTAMAIRDEPEVPVVLGLPLTLVVDER